MVACNDLRNTYVRERSNDAKKYLNELRQISYLDYINSEDLKTLRNEYLHWSAKANEFWVGPRFEAVLPIQKRKRKIHNG